MTRKLMTLEVRNREEWRMWLRTHHASSPGVWLVFFKDHAQVKSVPYEDSVREALCFGWVDSLIKRLDDRRYARKFTPRKPASKWSDSNRKRSAELKRAGLLAPAGFAAAPTASTYDPLTAIPELPLYIVKAFRGTPRAWGFFQKLAPSYKRHFVVWIHSAKRPETREKRIHESVALLEAGRMLGLK
jgi:uncharacterized protein YdeI (YjbR/CyaY-like superfamily)